MNGRHRIIALPLQPSHRILTAAVVLATALLFVRIGGAGMTWLPDPLWIGALVVLLLIVQAAARSKWFSRFPDRWRHIFYQYRFGIGVAAFMLLSVVIRLPHISGELWHAPIDIDENRLATNVRQFFVNGTIGHETVEHYPGVVFWMLVGSSLLMYLWGLMSGAIQSVQQMPVEMFTLAGRLTNVLIAAATVAFSGLIGRELSGNAVGFLGMLLVAIVPLSVDTTILLRNDPGQTLFIVAAVYAAMVAHRSGRSGASTMAGVLAGLATAIKYTSVLALVPALLAALLNGSRSQRVAKVAMALAGCLVAIALTNHFVWADFPNFLKQLSDQVAVWGPKTWSIERDPARLRTALLGQFGPGHVLLVLGAAYGCYSLAIGGARAWIFWSFPLLYSWLTMQRPTLFSRWVYPLLPFACVAGAAGLGLVAAAVVEWSGWKRLGGGRTLRFLALALVLAAALQQPVWGGTVSLSRRLRAPTHQIAEAWLTEHAKDGTVLVEDGFLDLTGTGVRAHRVPNLRTALQRGRHALYANDWVVVQESSRHLPELSQLVFAARIDAGQGFRGNTGPDYDIYATPQLPVSTTGDDVQLGEERGRPFLGQEWLVGSSSEGGLELPKGGASLFLPPFARESVNIGFELQAAPGDDLPVMVSSNGRSIPLTRTRAGGAGLIRLEGTVTLSNPARVTELRLRRGRTDSVRVVRFQFD